MIMNNFVALDLSDDFEYPNIPFNPPAIYPEFESTSILNQTNDQNMVYAKVRNVLKDLGFDNNRVDTPKWNPLSELIKRGDTIVIKPNLVIDEHPLGDAGALCTITHASVIRPIIDYILLATDGICSIIICDVPLQKANWERLILISGLRSLVEYYQERDIDLKLLDLRREISFTKDEIISSRDVKDRDPLGYSIINLGSKSELMPIINDYKKFEITDYGKGTVSKHHNMTKNEYCIPNTILSADVFINVPKLKTHRKAGLSCAMKNLIGINGDKRYIAHHRRGGERTGGDEYPEFNLGAWMKWHLWSTLKRYPSLLPFTRFIKKAYLGERSLREYSLESKDVMEGSWHGNDTIWRSIKDINKILFYADKNGMMTSHIQRKYLCIVDGIVAGEGEGPMLGTPKQTGIIVGGSNPVAVDKVCADVMGFDYNKIPTIKNGFSNKWWNLVDFQPDDIRTNTEITDRYKFKPSSGWVNSIEK